MVYSSYENNKTENTFSGPNRERTPYSVFLVNYTYVYFCYYEDDFKNDMMLG